MTARAGLLAVAILASGAFGAGQAAAKTRLTVYAVPTTAQFMNHADDRVRGMSTNPFNVKTQGLVIITKGKEKGNGPFPGDDILYSFKLFSGPKLEQRAGAAIFTCYYNFIKRAICDAYFELDDGVLLASGSVSFGKPQFVLSISGGTKKYLGALGEVTGVPTAKNAQRLDVLLLDQPR